MGDLEADLFQITAALRELTLEVRRQGRELQALHRLVESRLDYQVVSLEGESGGVNSAAETPTRTPISPNPYNPQSPEPQPAASSNIVDPLPSGPSASRLISDQEGHC